MMKYKDFLLRKEFSQEDLIPNEDTIVVVTRSGYINRMPPETFKTQSRGGKGVIGLTTKEEDVVANLFASNTHDNLLFFTDKGRVFQLKVYELPESSRISKGVAIVNLLEPFSFFLLKFDSTNSFFISIHLWGNSRIISW